MSADSSRITDSGGPGSSPAERVELGKVVGVWGVRGYVKIYSYTREPEGIARYPVWILHSPEGEISVNVIECRRQGRSLVAQLEGIEDRDQAGKMVGNRVSIRTSDLPGLSQGEYYWRQLIGLEVVNIEGHQLGRVEYLLETGANDVLVIADDSVQRLIPYVPEVINDVDLDAGVLTVDWQADWDENS